MAELEDPYKIQSKRKAVTAFFPYAVWRERDGERGMIDAFLGVVRASGSRMSLWHAIRPFIPTLFNEASPRTIVLTSPHIPWHSDLHDKENVVNRWEAAVAASVVPYKEEIGQSVTDVLLHIASVDALQPNIHTSSWSWLNKRPSLPPICLGRPMGTKKCVIRRVRKLGDIEILKSYFLLVWSEWDSIGWSDGAAEMRDSIRKEFGGIGMGNHRDDLIKHLDHVLGELDRGLGYLKQHRLWIDEDDVRRAKDQYGRLKEVLLEVDRGAMEVLTCTSSRMTILFKYSPQWNTQNPTQRLFVHSLFLAHSCVSAQPSLLIPPTPCFICASVSPTIVSSPRNSLDSVSYLQTIMLSFDLGCSVFVPPRITQPSVVYPFVVYPFVIIIPI